MGCRPFPTMSGLHFMSLLTNKCSCFYLYFRVIRQGGGCGLGFGAGWGFFAFGIGVVVKGMDDLTGKTQRQLKQMARKVAMEREAGIRPPRRSQALQEAGTDPLLDRIIRHIESRRKMRALSQDRL